MNYRKRKMQGEVRTIVMELDKLGYGLPIPQRVRSLRQWLKDLKTWMKTNDPGLNLYFALYNFIKESER